MNTQEITEHITRFIRESGEPVADFDVDAIVSEINNVMFDEGVSSPEDIDPQLFVDIIAEHDISH